MWAGREALAEEGWMVESSSRSPAFLHSFSSMWNHPSSHSLSIPCPSFQAQPKHILPWNQPGFISSCWVPEAPFTTLISHEGPSYSASSFVHVHTASLSSWGVRSVHQALFWNEMLIISNPHSEMPSKYWPHFTDEETEIKWGPHHWSESSQLLNRRAGIWTSSCQFRAFSFTSCRPDGDWRYIWNEDNSLK